MIYLLHIFAQTDTNELRQWFDTISELHECLCGTHYAYAARSGQVIDHNGGLIGKWIEATIPDPEL